METVEGAVREDVRPRESMEAARHFRKREQHVSSPKTGLSLVDLTEGLVWLECARRMVNRGGEQRSKQEDWFGATTHTTMVQVRREWLRR